MERIRAAIQKARETRTGQPAPPPGRMRGQLQQDMPVQQPGGGIWDELEVFRPRLDLMAKNRIVTFDQIWNAVTIGIGVEVIGARQLIGVLARDGRTLNVVRNTVAICIHILEVWI